MVNIVKNYLLSNKLILGKSFGTMFMKGLYMIIQILIMPSYLAFLGNNSLSGLWLTIVSLISWMVCFDFGIGNGLRTKLVVLLAKDNPTHTKEYISTSYFVISCVVFFIILGGSAIIFSVEVNKLFNISENIIAEADLRFALFVVLCGMSLQLLWNLINSVLYAIQNAVLPSVLNLLSLIAVLIYIRIPFNQPSDIKFLYLCFVYAVSFNLPSLLATIVVFIIKMREYRPSVFCIKKSLFRSVMKLGGQFFILQIIWVVISKSNEFLVLKLSSADAVVEYQIYYKVFSLVSTFAVVAMTPMWSAVTKAVTENNYMWIHKTYKVLLLVSILGIFFEIFIIFPLQWLVQLWLREDAIIVNWQIALLFALNNAMLIFHAANTNIANGMMNLKVQLYFYPFAAVLNIIGAIILVEITGHWAGVVISNIVVLVPFELIQFIDNKKSIKKNLINIGEKIGCV